MGDHIRVFNVCGSAQFCVINAMPNNDGLPLETPQIEHLKLAQKEHQIPDQKEIMSFTKIPGISKLVKVPKNNKKTTAELLKHIQQSHQKWQQNNDVSSSSNPPIAFSANTNYTNFTNNQQHFKRNYNPPKRQNVLKYAQINDRSLKQPLNPPTNNNLNNNNKKNSQQKKQQFTEKQQVPLLLVFFFFFHIYSFFK